VVLLLRRASLVRFLRACPAGAGVVMCSRGPFALIGPWPYNADLRHVARERVNQRSDGRCGGRIASNMPTCVARRKEESQTMPPPKKTRFQTFQRPKVRVTKISSVGKVYVDYKDVESLKKMLSLNGKILSRKRTGASAFEQRMITESIKRARFLGMLPYVGSGMGM
jgi:small subunit ribosomal protein S18